MENTNSVYTNKKNTREKTRGLLNRLRSGHVQAKMAQIVFSIFAIAAVACFAIWWFTPLHIAHNFIGTTRIVDIIFFFLVSYVIWHPIMMETLTWAISSHIKDIRQQKPVPGLKVAFITTIVPANESLELLHKCLPAMVHAKYPHDTWLLDEGNSAEVKKICRQYGVKYFTRFRRRKYNTSRGKFVKKTKGGNHNSWYDVYGHHYDIVAQIDTDFVPKSTFLTKTLGYFREPKVAFVGTPQVYGNTQDNLIAQGAAEQQYTFYGSVLRGLSGMGTTLLIGANHIIRVAALKDIGLYRAHITEDLLTGMNLHKNGWKSIYVPHALAIGEAPSTWEAYFNQQLRWAYGCIDILFHHSPRLFLRMGLRRTIYYFFLQQHYFSGNAMALSILLLSCYFFAGIRAADVNPVQFFSFYSIILLICWLMSVWLQQYNVNPKQEGELLLPGKMISIAAWPIWFIAFISVILRKRLIYKVTPKGENGKQPKTSIWIFTPHLLFGLIATAGLLSSFITHRQNIGMLFWASCSAMLMLAAPLYQRIWQVAAKLYAYTLNLLHFLFIPKTEKNFLDIAENSTYREAEQKLYIHEIVQDCLFLCIVMVMSFLLYAGKIGFYSDDWAFLGNFSMSSDQSLFGLIRTATTPNTFMRPMQNVYDTLLYLLFGVNPLGYQLVNMAVLIGIMLFLYLILRKVHFPRIIAIATALIYGLLPQYSTDRFWYAAFQANTSMLFYLFSLYAGLRAIAVSTLRTIIWKAVSVLSLLISVLSYEVVMPLVVLNLLLFWNPTEKMLNWKKSGKKLFLKNQPVFIVTTCIALFYLFIFKAMTTTRLGKIDILNDSTRITSSVFKVNYGLLVLNLPRIWGEIMALYPNQTVFALAGLIYFVIFWYLYSIASREKQFPARFWLRNLTFISFLVFVLGYAIFFTNNRVGFSPTGVDNRVAIAAAIGVALSIAGGGGWMLRMVLPGKAARFSFCILIALICAGNFLIINTIASFWSGAYEKQQAVLSAITERFPSLPQNSTIILDGICPYVGPGVVFESQWDLKGALQTMYHEDTIQADIVTPRLKIVRQGIKTQIYTFPMQYSYHNLFIYNFKTKKTYAIANFQAAVNYFQNLDPDHNNGCPPASAGNGVSIF